MDETSHSQPEVQVKRTNFYSEFRVVRTIASTDFGRTKICICTPKNSTNKKKVCVKSSVRFNGPMAHIIPDDRELEILRSLNHKNIIQLFAGYLNSQKVHLVMELCGTELGDFVMYKRALELMEVQRIGFMLLDAISAIHSLNIIHNDIKPSNVLFLTDPPPPDGDIKVIDFGLSVPLEMVGAKCGLNAGTYDFNAPEKANRPRNYGVEVDCWACGIVLFFCLYKTNPFQSHSDEDTRVRINRGFVDLCPHFVRDESIPQEFRDLIMGLLHPNPSERLTAMQARDHSFFSIDLSEKPERKVDDIHRSSFSLSSRSSISSLDGNGDNVVQPTTGTVSTSDTSQRRKPPIFVSRRRSSAMSLASKTVEEIKEREGGDSSGRSRPPTHDRRESRSSNTSQRRGSSNRSRRGSKCFVRHKDIDRWLSGLGLPTDQIQFCVDAFLELGILFLRELRDYVMDIHCLDGTSQHTWRDMSTAHLTKFKVDMKWISMIHSEALKIPGDEEQTTSRRNSRSEAERYITDFEKQLQQFDASVELSHKLKKLQEKYEMRDECEADTDAHKDMLEERKLDGKMDGVKAMLQKISSEE